MPSPSIGVLLVNLGTPDAPHAPEVRRYLREFLSDPRVLDISPIGRWLLLNLIILPLRPARSAEAYQKIWTAGGSPLLTHSRDLTEQVRAAVPELEVELAMRYGKPSIRAGLTALRDRGCERIVVFPLYPQYAASSTGSSVEAVYREAAKLWNTPYLSVVPPFYEDPGFIDAFAEVGAPVLAELQPDHVLYSFHGLPERHMHKSDVSRTHCLRSDSCCDQLVAANRHCYRAQCHATARALNVRLGLAPEATTISFQSRLGRAVWIRPYTDVVLPELARRGVKRVAVFCPAFVADCLETLEEIGMRAEADFKAAGGEALRLIPSLNAHPSWVRAAVDLIRETAPQGRRSLPIAAG
jgi:ferrochelatase